MNNAVTHYNRLCVNLRARVAVQQTGLWGVACLISLTVINAGPCGLAVMRGSVAARFVGLRVRILRGRVCPSLVSVVCCQMEVSASG